MNKLNKLQDLKTTLTQKQRIILLVVAVVVVLGALTATVFGTTPPASCAG